MDRWINLSFLGHHWNPFCWRRKVLHQSTGEGSRSWGGHCDQTEHLLRTGGYLGMLDSKRVWQTSFDHMALSVSRSWIASWPEVLFLLCWRNWNYFSPTCWSPEFILIWRSVLKGFGKMHKRAWSSHGPCLPNIREGTVWLVMKTI